MNDQHRSQDEFLSALYDELSDNEKADFNAHLEACESCSQEFEQMQKTLGLMSQRNNPEPNAEYWNTYWQTLSAKLQPINSSIQGQLGETSKPTLHVHRRLFLQIASAAAILLIGILIGHQISETPSPQTVHTNPPQATTNTQFVQDYLSRSEALLLGMVHIDIEQIDPQHIDLNHIKNTSRQLVREANLLQSQLTPNQHTLQNLVSDLEIILMQISNLESQQNTLGIDLIQHSVNRKSLLLRINLEELDQINNASSPVPSNPSSL